MNKQELTINKLAQDLIPIGKGVEWFSSSSENEKTEIMCSLDLCIHQSHPTKEDIELGITKSALKKHIHRVCWFVKNHLTRRAKKCLI